MWADREARYFYFAGFAVAVVDDQPGQLQIVFLGSPQR
jgi:hypothetical protein